MSKHMDSKTRDITLALAAIFQASYLVKQWAREGQTDDQAFEALLKSLLELNPQNINAVYGDIAHLKLGLETLVMFFESGSRARDKDIASYFVSLIVTQRKLQKNPAMLQKIQERIPFIQELEQELGVAASGSIGRGHGIHDTHIYNTRIDAINHTLATDDGLSTQRYGQSDVILIGVSRCGKTPTCLYLAMQFGLRASNFPFTEEVLDE